MADVCEITGTSLDIAGDVWSNMTLIAERSNGASVDGAANEVSIGEPYTIATNASGVMGTYSGGTFTSGFALVQGWNYFVTPYTQGGRTLKSFRLAIPDGTTAAGIDSLIVNDPVGSETAAALAVATVATFEDRVEALEAAPATGAEYTAGGPVACATTANITLSGEQTIDGVTTSASRVLVKDQTDAAENGIYVSAAGAWSRATDMDAAGEVAATAVSVLDGSVGIGKIFATYSVVTTLGTDDIVFVEAGSLASAAPLASPTFTGTPAAPNPSAGDDSTQIATTAWVQDEIDGIVTGTSTQYSAFGQATVPQVGNGAVAGAKYFWVTPTGGGTLAAVRLYAAATGTVTICRATIAGSSLTIQEEATATVSSTGVVLLDSSDFGAFVLASGDLIGIRGSGIVTRTNGEVTPDDGWYSTTNAVGVADTVSANTTSRIEVQWLFSSDTTEEVDTVTVANSDKILCIGDSYTQGGVALENHAWQCSVGERTMWPLRTFADGGTTAANHLGYLDDGTELFGAKIQDHAASHALVMFNENDLGSSTEAEYYDDLRNLVRALRVEGMEPILATEWGSAWKGDVDGETRNVAGLFAIAREENCHFIDVASIGNVMNPTQFADFWGGSHPATRTNYLISDPVEAWLPTLGAPSRAVKMFRPRSDVTVSTVADLMFATIPERARIWQEIQIAHAALSDADQATWDEIGGFSGGVERTDEYLALQQGGTVSFTDYALLHFTAPRVRCDALWVTLSRTDAEVYVRAYSSTAAEWAATVPDGAGRYAVPAGLSGDDLAVLVVQSGAFTLSDPSLTLIGGREVTRPVPQALARPSGAELLTQTNTGTTAELASWTATGTVAEVTPLDDTPAGTTRCCVVDASNYLAQSFTTASGVHAVEVEVSAWARRFPAQFDPLDDFATLSPVQYDSFDRAELRVDLTATGGEMSVELREDVGLWWRECRWRTILPPGQTRTLTVSAESGLQLAYVSVRAV